MVTNQYSTNRLDIMDRCMYIYIYIYTYRISAKFLKQQKKLFKIYNSRVNIILVE